MKVAITLEFTPNPNTLKFVLSEKLFERGAANFTTLEAAKSSPLAESVFKVDGISGVLVGTNFLTITKSPEGEWDKIADNVPKAIENHLAAEKPVFADGFDPNATSRADARGLMQLLPSTARSLHKGRSKKLYDYADNIALGSLFLMKLIKYFDGSRQISFTPTPDGGKKI